MPDDRSGSKRAGRLARQPLGHTLGGVSPEKVRFGIILHAREGLLSELEVYPLDADRAFTLPKIDRIEFFDAS